MTRPTLDITTERPLEGGALRILTLGAVGASLLLYSYFAISILFLSVLLLVEVGIFVMLLRIGLSRVLLKPMTCHGELLTHFAKSLFLRKGNEARVLLRTGEAPGLFAAIGELSERSGVTPPEEVSIELSTNAWVRLDGFRRGAGGTRLGIGYDLLAGLNEIEMRAVLAHEISHARLVERGLKRWLGKTLSRSNQLAGGLYALRERCKELKAPSQLAAGLFRVADRLARLIARLFACCSRQDEYAADRGAADLCGSAAMRSALLKLDPISLRASRLPWAERVARLQGGERFSPWLVRELTETEVPATPDHSASFDDYATHPSLPNRLAALPPAEAPETGQGARPALGLLADPDRVAERLIAEIHKIAANQEEKDSARLDKWARKTGRSQSMTTTQGIAAVVLICSLIWLLMSWSIDGLTFTATLWPMLLGVGGTLLYRAGIRRDRLSLPMPGYAALRESGRRKSNPETQEQLDAIEKELKSMAPAGRRPRHRGMLLAREAYKALETHSYARARIASVLCLREEKKSLEGHLALAVAAAARGESELSAKALNFLRLSANITQGSLAWGSAWALVLLGDWQHAEALLRSLLRQDPAQPTPLALLALSQSRRGKIQSAVVSVRKAVALRPADDALRSLLVEMLITAGFLREAAEHIGPPESEFARTRDMQLAQLRIRLLTQDREGAGPFAEAYMRHEPAGPAIVTVASLFEEARFADRAAELYSRAIGLGHHPEARLGFARILAQRGDNAGARRELLAALDSVTPVVEGSAGAPSLFGGITSQLRALEPSMPGCRAWIVRVEGKDAPAILAGVRLWVCAQSEEGARARLEVILNALRPGKPPLLPGLLHWEPAPAEQQPDRPIPPGVLLAA